MQSGAAGTAGTRRRRAIAEQVGDPGLGHLLDEQREDFGPIGDHADVGGIPLVPGAAVGEAVERDAGEIARHHSSTNANEARTWPRGTRHEAEFIRGVIAVRTPPPPPGPQV